MSGKSLIWQIWTGLRGAIVMTNLAYLYLTY